MKTLNDIFKPKDLKQVSEIIDEFESHEYWDFIKEIIAKIENGKYKQDLPIFKYLCDLGVHSRIIFVRACRFNCHEIVEIMLESNIDPTFNHQESLKAAYHNNAYEVVDILMKNKRVTNNLTQNEIINLQIYLDSVLE